MGNDAFLRKISGFFLGLRNSHHIPAVGKVTPIEIRLADPLISP